MLADKREIREIALSLNDEDTALLTKLERDFISKIGAGCSAPVAVNATLEGDEVKIEAMVGFPDGTNIIHKKFKIVEEKLIILELN